MSASVFLGILALLALGSWVAFGLITSRSGLGRLLFKASWTLTAVFAAFPIYMEAGDAATPRGDAAVVSFGDDGRVDAVSFCVFCWDQCANVVTRTSFKSSVTPITENPKARHLTYEVEVEVADWNKYFTTTGVRPKDGKIPEIEENHEALKRAVSYQLAEFNEAKSRELARFYNPWDDQQVHDLEDMLRAYLEPHLATRGVRFVRLQSFSVE